MKNKIKNFAKKLNIPQMGVCNIDDDTQAIVFLFPYYVNSPKGNISKYAIGPDYHKVIHSYLLKVGAYISSLCKNDAVVDMFCDISPYDDRNLAYKAGLGFYGKNSLLINPRYGSFFFIGYIVTRGLCLEADSPLNLTCTNCNCCIKSCPGKAISENGILTDFCASAISQKKGELKEEEILILKNSGYSWGCDVCQDVCPHNSNIPLTPIKEFLLSTTPSLTPEDIAHHSERSFKKAFENKAFAWRGKKTLLRNLLLTSQNNKE